MKNLIQQIETLYLQKNENGRISYYKKKKNTSVQLLFKVKT